MTCQALGPSAGEPRLARLASVHRTTDTSPRWAEQASLLAVQRCSSPAAFPPDQEAMNKHRVMEHGLQNRRISSEAFSRFSMEQRRA
jgi:hypothetical protein